MLSAQFSTNGITSALFKSKVLPSSQRFDTFRTEKEKEVSVGTYEGTSNGKFNLESTNKSHALGSQPQMRKQKSSSKVDFSTYMLLKSIEKEQQTRLLTTSQSVRKDSAQLLGSNTIRNYTKKELQIEKYLQRSEKSLDQFFSKSKSSINGDEFLQSHQRKTFSLYGSADTTRVQSPEFDKKVSKSNNQIQKSEVTQFERKDLSNDGYNGIHNAMITNSSQPIIFNKSAIHSKDQNSKSKLNKMFFTSSNFSSICQSSAESSFIQKPILSPKQLEKNSKTDQQNEFNEADKEKINWGSSSSDKQWKIYRKIEKRPLSRLKLQQDGVKNTIQTCSSPLSPPLKTEHLRKELQFGVGMLGVKQIPGLVEKKFRDFKKIHDQQELIITNRIDSCKIFDGLLHQGQMKKKGRVIKQQNQKVFSTEEEDNDAVEIKAIEKAKNTNQNQINRNSQKEIEEKQQKLIENIFNETKQINLQYTQDACPQLKLNLSGNLNRERLNLESNINNVEEVNIRNSIAVSLEQSSPKNESFSSQLHHSIFSTKKEFNSFQRSSLFIQPLAQSSSLSQKKIPEGEHRSSNFVPPSFGSSSPTSRKLAEGEHRHSLFIQPAFGSSSPTSRKLAELEHRHSLFIQPAFGSSSPSSRKLIDGDHRPSFGSSSPTQKKLSEEENLSPLIQRQSFRRGHGFTKQLTINTQLMQSYGNESELVDIYKTNSVHEDYSPINQTVARRQSKQFTRSSFVRAAPKRSVFLKEGQLPVVIKKSNLKPDSDESSVNSDESLEEDDKKNLEQISFAIPELVKALGEESSELTEDISTFCTEDISQFLFWLSQFSQFICSENPTGFMSAFKLCPIIVDCLLAFLLKELLNLNMTTDQVSSFRKAFKYHQKLIMAKSLEEKLGGEVLRKKIIEEVIDYQVLYSQNSMYEMKKKEDLVDSLFKIMKGILKCDKETILESDWGDANSFSAADIFEIKRGFLTVLRRHDRYYDEQFCFAFIEQIERSRVQFEKSVQLYRLYSDSTFISNLITFLDHQQSLFKFQAQDRESLLSTLTKYVFSPLITSQQASLIIQDLNVNGELLIELEEAMLSNLRLEREYIENVEYSLLFKYKFQKLSWIINNNNPINSVKHISSFYKVLSEEVERQQKITGILEHSDSHVHYNFFLIIQLYFSQQDNFNVKDALQSITFPVEDKTQIFEFWIDCLKSVLGSTSKIPTIISEVLYSTFLMKKQKDQREK